MYLFYLVDSEMDTTDKTVEEKYQKKDLRQHIYDIPDTYIGSVNITSEPIYVIQKVSIDSPVADYATDAASEAGSDTTSVKGAGKKNSLADIEMTLKNIEYVPGLYKIFDEIIVNAIDHKVRDNSLKNIKVTIDKTTGVIEVYNDGNGIPIVLHKEHNVYVPELLFGNLLTSSNYDKEEKKITGGKNGFGAKVTNIFSKWFEVETCDSNVSQKYSQKWSENMTIQNQPIIKSFKGKPYTKVSFLPDYKRFGLQGITDDIELLFERRVYDLAALTPKDVTVHYNGKALEIKSFEKYTDLYLGDKKEKQRVHEIVNDRWEICATYNEKGTFEQVSFVNGIWTKKGGKHVEYVSNAIVKKLTQFISDRNKKMNIKTSYVKENLFLFVKSTIENPSFTSQTKEELSTPSKDFGSKCEISDAFISKLAKCGIMDRAIEICVFQESKDLKKSDGKKKSRIVGIPKLDDANKAGTAESSKCVLILTEGDSAKSSAICGLSVVGRDYYGVFPLKGKLLNVRDAAAKKVIENQELANLKQIIGLKQFEDDGITPKKYTSVDDLRYGCIMIMTDADVDGSHIKGLLINWLGYSWANTLLKIPGFVKTIRTPILKARKGNQVIPFYSLAEYDAWKNENDSSNWTIKYYKGLGTSSAQEFKEYFSDLNANTVEYIWDNDECANAIDLAFSAKRADDRKEWLKTHNESVVLDTKQNKVSYTEFINKDFIHFSNYDNIRSIPNVMDGLKPSQRKCIYACLKKHQRSEVKVAQISGYISEQTSYHHGEVSLQSTLVGMAQDFVGSNNINLLKPIGQFGTRNKGGDDAASARYIFTCLSDITEYLFNKDDNPLLKYLEDDGTPIEPAYYAPVLPMVLINGVDGIGTGYSTKIPCYNPRQIAEVILDKLNNNKPFEDHTFIPWYNKFNGTITVAPDSNGSVFICKGKYKVSATQVEITELPVGVWTEEYIDFLNSVLPLSDNKKHLISSYTNNSTEEHVNITIKFDKEKLVNLVDDDLLEKELKLVKNININNTHLYDPNGSIKRYNSVADILNDYYHIRYDLYVKRKQYQLAEMKKDIRVLENRRRFMECVMKEEILVFKKKTSEIIEQLEAKSFDRYNPQTKDIDLTNKEGYSYNYLTKESLDAFSFEKINDLESTISNKKKEYDILHNTSETDIWKNDIQNCLKMYDKLLADQAAASSGSSKTTAAAVKKTTKKK